MSGTESAQLTEWAFWTPLCLGAALVSISLIKSTGRFRQWKNVQDWHAGEIVLADRQLTPGQIAQVFEEGLPPGESAGYAATLATIEKRTVTLALERDSAGEREVEAQCGWPVLGSSVAIAFPGATALYQFVAQVRDLRRDPECPAQWLLTVPRPVWLARVQRRKHVRASIDMPATFEAAGPDSSSRPPLHGILIDLSGGGLRARVGNVMRPGECASLIDAFEPGTVVNVRIPVPALSNSPLLARVRSSQRIAVLGGLGLQLACEFLPMPSWEQELLVQHIFRAQRDRWARMAPLRKAS